MSSDGGGGLRILGKDLKPWGLDWRKNCFGGGRQAEWRVEVMGWMGWDEMQDGDIKVQTVSTVGTEDGATGFYSGQVKSQAVSEQLWWGELMMENEWRERGWGGLELGEKIWQVTSGSWWWCDP